MTQINDTGVKGFLLWLKREQPGIYVKAAPIIAQQVPQAFSGYNAGAWRVAGLGRYEAMQRLGAMGDSTTDINLATATPADVFGDSATIDLSTSSSPLSTASLATPPTVDVSTAANSGASSSGIASTISSIVGGISALYLTKQQANIQQQVVNTQLSRAAAGLPPLPASLSNLGVPQVSVGLSAGTGTGIAVAAGIGLLVLLFMMGGKKRA